MLFNSYEFILFFLPITLAVYFLLARAVSSRAAIVWVTLASLFFYAWWNPAFLALLLASITFNYWLGALIVGAVRRGGSGRRRLLVFGVVANLAVLGYYKYSDFFVSNLDMLAGLDLQMQAVILPLAISFYTFTQITYLVDAAKGEAEQYDFVRYCLFVTFFPHLIAGPILHHREMMPQFAQTEALRFNHSNLAVGLTYFALGLFKKVIIADSMVPFATPVFAAAAGGEALSAIEAWKGVLAYTLQLYFDFSGYSDMAVGLARMFGIRLPFNFNSPYKAVNIIDFWRRWHITLSRFLREYVYIPLGGNRRGPARRHANLLMTMLIGGLWHGAGWTYVVWGALHGLYLVINHAWHALRAWAGFPVREGSRWGRAVARLVTLLAVMVGWVFFRSQDLDAAFSMLEAMAGANGFVAASASEAAAFAPLSGWPGLAELGGRIIALDALLFMGALLALSMFGANTQEWIELRSGARGSWRPHPIWAPATAAMLLFSFSQLSDVSEFLYFQF